MGGGCFEDWGLVNYRSRCDSQAMGNAIWLLTALPSWYFEAALAPLSAGVLTIVPALGVLALIVGVILGGIKRQRELLWFLTLFGASELLVVVAGFERGQVRANGTESFLNTFFLSFLAAQLAVSGYLTYRFKEARASALALSLFCITYAAAAAFVAAMSFTDSWL